MPATDRGPAAFRETSLSDPERDVLARLIDLLAEEFGDGLNAVWLYGSRARGEPRRPESDIDVIVLTSGGRRDRSRVYELLGEAADEGGVNPSPFAVYVSDLAWLRGRREIDAFFIQEVDRDKVVLHGDVT